MTTSASSLVPLGAELSRRYYTAPTPSGTAPEQHEEPGFAALAALDAWSASDSGGQIPPPVIDEHWVMRTADGETVDLLVDRSRVAIALTTGAFMDRAERAAAANTAAAAIRRVLAEHAEADALP